ncbi:MAG: hypothetical protein K2Y01_04190 [Rhabdochlamydiaceae bacterium]|nr:hypothetical protein [Rhabdochlamydiaceae bacterium]
MWALEEKIAAAVYFLKEKSCAQKDLNIHKQDLLQAGVDDEALYRLTEGQRH